MKENEHGHHRGLHIVIIRPSDGKVIMAKSFDTYKSPVEFDNYVKWNKHPTGYIMVIACKDECSTLLSRMSKDWLKNMGSREFGNIGYRCGFVWIGKIRGRDPMEKRAITDKDEVSVT